MRTNYFSLPLFFILSSQFSSAASSTPVSEFPQVSGIVSGSACPGKQTQKIKFNLDSDVISIPMDFEVDFKLNGRKTCQSRITFNPGPKKQYVIKQVSQNLLFNLKEKMSMTAAISFGIVGGQEFKIDDSVEELGEHRRFLIKKLIGYTTSCGKESMFRIQTDVNFRGKGSASFKTEPLQLIVELSDCEAPLN
jgi:hypothetical protein